MTTTPTQAGDYTFYATADYFAKLVQDIDNTKSGDRVLLAAMAFDPTVPAIAAVITALARAGERGVHATLQIDSYVYLVDEQKHFGPLFYGTKLPAKLKGIFKNIHGTVAQLEQHGVTVVVTNPPSRRFSSPFSGRSHIKASVINNIVYLGGCNLSAMHSDVMVRTQNAELSNWLYHLFARRIEEPKSLEAFGAKDIRHTVDEQTDIIVDVGIKHQSTIYEQALQVIDDANDWLVITCQYFPNSITAKHLKAASKRGVKVFTIFNHYSSHSHAHAYLQRAVTGRERMRMPAAFFAGELPRGANYLHAKILANEKEAMIGSHNYVTAGVNFGTAEIALYRRDPAFAKAAAATIIAETNMQDVVKLPL